MRFPQYLQEVRVVNDPLDLEVLGSGEVGDEYIKKVFDFGT